MHSIGYSEIFPSILQGTLPEGVSRTDFGLCTCCAGCHDSSAFAFNGGLASVSGLAGRNFPNNFLLVGTIKLRAGQSGPLVAISTRGPNRPNKFVFSVGDTPNLQWGSSTVAFPGFNLAINEWLTFGLQKVGNNVRLCINGSESTDQIISGGVLDFTGGNAEVNIAKDTLTSLSSPFVDVR